MLALAWLFLALALQNHRPRPRGLALAWLGLALAQAKAFHIGEAELGKGCMGMGVLRSTQRSIQEMETHLYEGIESV